MNTQTFDGDTSAARMAHARAVERAAKSASSKRATTVHGVLPIDLEARPEARPEAEPEAKPEAKEHGAPSTHADAPRALWSTHTAGLHGAALQALVRAYVCHAPMALTLRELNRLLAIEALPALEKGRILDVGCGDGFWWTVRNRRHCHVYGIDINAHEVGLAAQHIQAEVCDVARAQPFAQVRFDEIIGNCSLEHVHNLEGALTNLRRAAAPRARLILFVPSQMWAYQGLMQRTLLRRAPRLGMAFAGLMNGFFQHWHVYPVAQWKRMLRDCGWRVTQAHGLGNARSEFLFRMLLPQAFASFTVKSLFGQYPSKLLRHLPDGLMRRPVDLLTWALTDPLVDAEAASAYEYMLVAEADAHA